MSRPLVAAVRPSRTPRTRRSAAAVAAREHAVPREVGGDLTDADLRTRVRVLAQTLTLFDTVDVNRPPP
ncbi:hypothetical protein ACFYQA_33025 [Streptomyces sp. NPDC005774]|uniref:hypothetical protein n=1 Tax=Streptomyces sp. NPDC005774 TaxID=3364728 RepID=UPI003679DFC2